MGDDMYLVSYKNSGIPRNYEFYDALEKEFTNYDGNGNLYIENHRLKEWLEEQPDMKEKYKEELAILQALLEENTGCIEMTRG